MNSIVQNPQLNSIFNSLNSLTINELDEVMQQVIGIRKQKMPNVLTAVETDLLKRINTPIPSTIQKRYNKLLKLKVTEQLNDDDYRELLALTTFVEGYDNQRLRYIIELSQYRNQNLEEVLNSLGLKQKLNVI